jgi:hypothetical protein
VPEDVRSKAPDDNNRRKGNFKKGWNHTVEGNEYTSKTLKELTWQNLGYRFGKLLGKTSINLQEEMCH